MYELRIKLNNGVKMVISSSENYGFLVERAIGIAMYQSRVLGEITEFENPTKEDQEEMASTERILDKWTNNMYIVKIDKYNHVISGHMYVKMHDYYTATVRCLASFENYIKKEPDNCLLEVQLSLIHI